MDAQPVRASGRHHVTPRVSAGDASVNKSQARETGGRGIVLPLFCRPFHGLVKSEEHQPRVPLCFTRGYMLSPAHAGWLCSDNYLES